MTIRLSVLKVWLVLAVILAGVPVVLSGCCELHSETQTIDDVPYDVIVSIADVLQDISGSECIPNDTGGSCTYYVDLNDIDEVPPGEEVLPATVTLQITPTGDGLYNTTITISVVGCEREVALPDLIAPSIFLANVCEPNNGFSADGWMTLDTDADNLGMSTALQYGATQEGPWLSLEAAGPPWVFNQANFEAMAQAAGIASYTDLWFKVGDTGRANHLGSMVRDRSANMEALCSQ